MTSTSGIRKRNGALHTMREEKKKNLKKLNAYSS